MTEPAAHRLSASKLVLARSCLHSFRGDVEVPYDPPGPAAERGKRIHAAIESFYIDGEIATLDKGDEQEVFAAFLDWEDRRREAHPCDPVPEVAYRLNVLMGESRRVDRDRAKRARPGSGEITAVADLIERVDGKRYLSDFKTGQRTDTADQLATCALAMQLDDKRDGVTGPIFVRAVYLSRAGVASDEWTEMDAMDLDAHLVTLRRMLRRLPTAEPVPGEHCKAHYCRLRETCKAHRAWLKEHRGAQLRGLAAPATAAPQAPHPRRAVPGLQRASPRRHPQMQASSHPRPTAKESLPMTDHVHENPRALIEGVLRDCDATAANILAALRACTADYEADLRRRRDELTAALGEASAPKPARAPREARTQASTPETRLGFVLSALELESPQTLQEVAKMAGVPRAAAQVAIDTLLTDGRVTRERAGKGWRYSHAPLDIESTRTLETR